MGCLLSKKSSSPPSTSRLEKTLSMARTDIRNALHSKHTDDVASSSQTNFSSLTRIVLQQVTPVDERPESISLLSCPPAEKLLCGHEIFKRGHMVRNWKQRYCVLDKSDLKYYLARSEHPPYGEGFKGKVALLGAVCVATPSEDGKTIEVEIYGNHGEKDLFFHIENNESGNEFLRILQWAIRKVTLAMLSRNLKMAMTDKALDRRACTEWIEHHNLLYQASIQSLQPPGVFHFVNIEESGEIVIRPGLMRLWTAFGGDFVPDLRTDARHMGLAWKFISPESLSKVLSESENNMQATARSQPRRGSQMVTEAAAQEDVRVFTFEDIADVTYQYIDKDVTKWLEPHMKALHHTEVCSVERYIVVTLHSLFGHDLHILACCLHDYNEAILSLRHILLFIQARNKLQRGVETNKSITKERPTAAAMAVLLLGDE